MENVQFNTSNVIGSFDFSCYPQFVRWWISHLFNITLSSFCSIEAFIFQKKNLLSHSFEKRELTSKRTKPCERRPLFYKNRRRFLKRWCFWWLHLKWLPHIQPQSLPQLYMSCVDLWGFSLGAWHSLGSPAESYGPLDISCNQYTPHWPKPHH